MDRELLAYRGGPSRGRDYGKRQGVLSTTAEGGSRLEGCGRRTFEEAVEQRRSVEDLDLVGAEGRRTNHSLEKSKEFLRQRRNDCGYVKVPRPTRKMKRSTPSHLRNRCVAGWPDCQTRGGTSGHGGLIGAKRRYGGKVLSRFLADGSAVSRFVGGVLNIMQAVEALVGDTAARGGESAGRLRGDILIIVRA